MPLEDAALLLMQFAMAPWPGHLTPEKSWGLLPEPWRAMYREQAARIIAAGSAVPTHQTNVTPAAVIADLGSIVTGMSAMFPKLLAAAPSLIPAPLAAQIQGDLSLAQQADATLTANVPAATGATTAQKIEGYVDAVFAVLAGPPINGLIPAQFNLVLTGVAVLLPGIEAFFNQYLTAAPTVSASLVRAQFRAAAPAMTPAEARLVLAGYAAK